MQVDEQLLSSRFETSNRRGVKVTLCQPGPIATGVQGQVRSLYGSKGLLTESTESDAELRKRHNPKRVAELILRAAYHGLDSCWIAKHPVLLLGAPLLRSNPLERSLSLDDSSCCAPRHSTCLNPEP